MVHWFITAWLAALVNNLGKTFINVTLGSRTYFYTTTVADVAVATTLLVYKSAFSLILLLQAVGLIILSDANITIIQG